MRGGRILVTLLLAGLLAGASLAPAATTPKRPVAGKWKLTDTGFNFVGKGSFKLDKGAKHLASLSITPGSGASLPCGTAALKLKGKRRLSKATRAGVSIWIVGKNAPKTSNGIAPVKVKVTQAGRTLQATLYVGFEGRRRGNGALVLPNCQLDFDATR